MTTHLVIAVVALAAACTPQRKVDEPLPAADETRIPHPRHAQVPCESCHRGARPGSDDHKPCDDGACHRKDFTGEPTRLCEVCHSRVTAKPLAAPLKPSPVEDAWQAEPSRFSHRRHLGSAAMEDRVGFHVTCTDCHARTDAGLARPDHAACARCHAPEVALAGAPRMADCGA